MKKIQITTEERTANVQIISVNSYLIAKAIKAQLKMRSALEGTKTPAYERDADNNYVKDANGNKIQKTDEKGNVVYNYSRYINNENDMEALHEALEFLDELCQSFEEQFMWLI